MNRHDILKTQMSYGDRCLASEGEGVASNATCTRGVDALHIY